MKTTQIFLFALMGCTMALGQTNTFPASGNVGIGTTSPTSKLVVNGSGMKLGGSFTQTNLRIEAADESGAPAKTVGLELRGYEGRGKGIYITDKNTSHKWFIGEGYAYQGIGIGYSTTSQMEYSANAKFFVGTSGNVGIGTTDPSGKLHVMAEGAVIKLQNTVYEDTDDAYSGWLGGYDKSGDEIWWLGEGSTDKKQLGLYTNRDGYDLRIFAKGNGLIVKNDGNVGIGTEAPGAYKLAVNGNVRAKEIKVETGWSDFVFEEDYKLPSLEEVEEHIQDKGHLKDIPSAEEVAENGILLGEMDSKLLQKIEELTLYTIAQEKRIKHLEKENKTLRSITERMAKIEALLETK